ncbi:hypothetical protein B2J88_50465 [Rhodococcus sp. SRB_17]|nr:hypothetical protein [Rhodococcus sp. SRB_17]
MMKSITAEVFTSNVGRVAMEIQGTVERSRAEIEVANVFGEPYETSDGTTIVTVTRLHRRRGGGPVPVGVFLIHDGKASWSPALDLTRLALMAEFIGLVSAVIATLAVLRRPPWPDLSNRRFVPTVLRSPGTTVSY